MKKLLAAGLIATMLSVPAMADTPREQAGRIQTGAKVEVQLSSGEKVKGLLGPVSDESVSVTVNNNPRVLPWASVTRVKKPMGRGKRAAIITLIVLGALSVVGSRV